MRVKNYACENWLGPLSGKMCEGLVFLACLLLPLLARKILRLPELAFVNFTDSVFYLSYSQSFQELFLRHGFIYYASRFGAIFPDAVAFNLFGPTDGPIVLRLFLACFVSGSLFRYQIWHSRLMIPAVAVAAPGVGIFLGSIRWRGISSGLVLLMAAWLTPSFSSWARPIVGNLTVFRMDEDAAVSRAGSGSSYLPSFGKTMAASGAKNVWLDLEIGVVHAALRYLPLSTSYGFPRSGNAENFPAGAVLSNRKPTELDEKTTEFLSGMELVSRMEKWSLWLPVESSVKLESITGANDLPPLWGCMALDGLGEWQGPYPQYNVGVFAKKESGKVRFKSTRALKSARLLFDGAPEGAPIPIIITHAGSNIYSGNISKKTGLSKFELGQVNEGDIFEIQIPEAESFRIYSFGIFNKI